MMEVLAVVFSDLFMKGNTKYQNVILLRKSKGKVFVERIFFRRLNLSLKEVTSNSANMLGDSNSTSSIKKAHSSGGLKNSQTRVLNVLK